MTDFFKPDPRRTDPAMRDLEKKVHWLMYQIAQSNRSTLWEGAGLDSGQIISNTFPDNFDVDNIANDADEVQNNNSD
jgi:hypothetical protein